MVSGAENVGGCLAPILCGRLRTAGFVSCLTPWLSESSSEEVADGETEADGEDVGFQSLLLIPSFLSILISTLLHRAIRSARRARDREHELLARGGVITVHVTHDERHRVRWNRTILSLNQ